MRDPRGVPYTQGCTVVYIAQLDVSDYNAKPEMTTATVNQVIEITGELIIDKFTLPIAPGGQFEFMVVPPRPPEVLFEQALDNLLQAKDPEDLRIFTSAANEALRDTKMWVRRLFPQAVLSDNLFSGKILSIPPSATLVRRSNRGSGGFPNRGVGVEFKGGKPRLHTELDITYNQDQDFADPSFIKSQVMKWFNQEMQRA